MSLHAPVVILFGGSSSERLVSVASAQNVSRQLPTARLWFLDPTGGIHEVPAEQLAAHERPFERELALAPPPDFGSLSAALAAPGLAETTFFLALHGGDGEDGTIQRKLEERHLSFTGSGSRASADAFDKARAKQLAGARGATLAAAHLLPPLAAPEAVAALRSLLAERPRWVLKPVSDGSSFGLIHLRATDQVLAAAAVVERLKVRYLAEQFIEGRELTVGVIDSQGGPVALPVSEVRLAPDAAFDYAGKYLGRGTEEITPAQLPPDRWEQAQRLAVLGHEAIGCYGYSRTDMILTADGPVFLETNTLPGLTRASFIPQQLAAAHRDFGEFLRGQVALARKRAGLGN
jgi:D-alanine-D-alanine ligase